MTSTTKIDYVTLTGTDIGIKLNRNRLLAMRIIVQTDVQSHDVKYKYRLSDSRWYLR